jgi:hypothetical protein
MSNELDIEPLAKAVYETYLRAMGYPLPCPGSFKEWEYQHHGPWLAVARFVRAELVEAGAQEAESSRMSGESNNSRDSSTPNSGEDPRTISAVTAADPKDRIWVCSKCDAISRSATEGYCWVTENSHCWTMAAINRGMAKDGGEDLIRLQAISDCFQAVHTIVDATADGHVTRKELTKRMHEANRRLANARNLEQRGEQVKESGDPLNSARPTQDPTPESNKR